MPPLQPRELYLGFRRNFSYLVKSGGEGASDWISNNIEDEGLNYFWMCTSHPSNITNNSIAFIKHADNIHPQHVAYIHEQINYG